MFYISQLSNITISSSPTVQEVNENNSKLDGLYTQAMFDHALIKRKEVAITIDLKNSEAELFNVIKKQQLANDPTTKLTENDVKGLVKTYLLNNCIGDHKLPIYVLLKAISSRLIFIDRVVDIIEQKKASLVTANGMLKLEKSFSGTKDNHNVNCYA